MIELVAIGNELLQGKTLNTNVAFLSQELSCRGYRVDRHTVLPDEAAVLVPALREVFKRASVVILTGGLGPTCDDITRQVVAEIFDSPLAHHAEIAADLERRYGKDLLSLKDQSLVPVKSRPLKNPVGTAPGLLFEEKGKIGVLLPGVPKEMQVIFSDQVLPYLLAAMPSRVRGQVIFRYLHTLQENQIDPLLRELQAQYPSVEIGIYPGYGIVRLSFYSADEVACRACVAAVDARFSGYLYQTLHGTLEEGIQDWFVAEKKTLACAESCTGGRVSAALTHLPGASSYFLGSFVTYANAVKTGALGVPPALLELHGAVSREVVTAMWQGVLAHTSADIALAVSGIAGPGGGSAQKPIGTIWMAIGARDTEPQVHCATILGQDREVRLAIAVNRLLGALYRYTVCQLPAFFQ